MSRACYAVLLSLVSIGATCQVEKRQFKLGIDFMQGALNFTPTLVGDYSITNTLEAEVATGYTINKPILIRNSRNLYSGPFFRGGIRFNIDVYSSNFGLYFGADAGYSYYHQVFQVEYPTVYGEYIGEEEKAWGHMHLLAFPIGFKARFSNRFEMDYYFTFQYTSRRSDRLSYDRYFVPGVGIINKNYNIVYQDQFAQVPFASFVFKYIFKAKEKEVGKEIETN